MTDPHPEIVAHYEVYNEVDRLTKKNRLEFLRTTEIIKRHLPQPPAVVADVGGGPGVYATWLALQGYRVHLFDVVPRHVEAARASESDLVTAEIGDARRLPLENACVDTVLLLGPLYHLVEREDRIAALREARRILRPGGMVFAAGISRFASALDGAHNDLVADPEFRRMVDRALIDGQHRNPTKNPLYFTTAFFHRPEELHAEVLEAGFVDAEVLAVESIGWAVPNLDQTLDDGEACDRLLGVLARLEAEQALLGASPTSWRWHKALIAESGAVGDRMGFLSHPRDKLVVMETKLISLLLANQGIRAELIFDGATTDCPHCNQLGSCDLSEAA